MVTFPFHTLSLKKKKKICFILYNKILMSWFLRIDLGYYIRIYNWLENETHNLDTLK